MDRKQFIALMGAGAAGAMLASCMGGCSKVDNGKVDFTLDLSKSENSALNTNGGYLYSNGVIVARTMSGTYIAVSSSCTHEGTSVRFDGANNRFQCPNHGARFSTSGAVTLGPATRPLTQYNVTQSGTTLRVYS